MTKMQAIKNSFFLKAVSYILLPIIVASLILSIIYISLSNEYGNSNNLKESYFNSSGFSYEYISNLISNIRRIDNGYIEENNNGIYSKIEDNIYYTDYEFIHNDITSYIKYIIINNETNELYTNVQSSNYLEDTKTFSNKKMYWIYENKDSISTNIVTLSKNKIKYLISSFGDISYITKYSIYSYLDIDNFDFSNYIKVGFTLLSIFDYVPFLADILIPLDIVLLCIIIVYLLWSIGHSKTASKIHLTALDRFPYELLLIVFFTIFGMCFSFFEVILLYANIPTNLVISLLFIGYIGAYISLAIIVDSTIRRIKAKEFWHSFLVYKIYNRIKKYLHNASDRVLDKSPSQRNIIIFYIIFIVISSILGLTFFTGISFLILLAFWIWTLYLLLQFNKRLNKIKNALHEIYMGNSNINLDTDELKGTLKELAIYVNDISNGFNNAIQEKLKSERLKTELITNVSHDIKTPLTSIINYVDLLKQEDIKDEKALEYLNVLDSKSQRLKKLIEDLVEASKASSGNVKLNIEEINLSELLKQVTGEFKDKFDEKNLSIDLELPDNSVNIEADNRYMYRIIENLYSNVSKYAMDNTRVYISLNKGDNEIKLEIKNISKEKLNISADELMQRFVRGDKSRFTEGSGLGLSIAKSLSELQNCKFNIEIDGDLFKAILIWNIK